MKLFQAELGYTVVEILLGLLFGAALVLAILSSTQHTITTAAALRRAGAVEQSFERAELVIRQLAESSLLFRAFPGITVERGRGELMAALSSHSSVPPAPESDILLFRLLASEVSLRDTAAAGDSLSTSVWCMNDFEVDREIQEAPQNVSSPFVLLTLDGIWDVEAQREASPGRCQEAFRLMQGPILTRYQFQSNGSQFLPPLSSWFALIRADDHAAVYLDRRGMLRRASLLNRSNRSIAGPFAELSATVADAGLAPAVRIQLTGREKGDRRVFHLALPLGGASTLDIGF